MVEKIDKVGHNDACLEFTILVKEIDVVGMQVRRSTSTAQQFSCFRNNKKKKELHKFIWKAWLDVS